MKERYMEDDRIIEISEEVKPYVIWHYQLILRTIFMKE